MQPVPHERFSEKVQLDFESVKAYAASVGDSNPLHHSREAAARSRFKRPIASGTQTGALLMALTAKRFSQGTRMVGLTSRSSSGRRSTRTRRSTSSGW